MKHMSLCALVSLFLALPAAAQAASDGSGSCRDREQAILKQMDYAGEYGDRDRLRGLERALVNVRAHCSDDDLIARSQERVAEKRRDVEERQRDLTEARAEGKDADKIAKRQRKLEEAQADLEKAIRERDVLLGASGETAN